jgi:hypothetical protein
MSNKNLFQEAIADAKAIREAALANAKAALEETMTPKLQSMIAARLEEDYGIGAEADEEDYEGEMEEGFRTNDFNFGDEDNSKSDQNKMDESDTFDLSEILAELDEEYSLEEAKKNEDDEDDEDEEDEADEKEGETEKGKDDEEIEMPTNVEDLTALITDLINQEMAKIKSKNAPEEGGEMSDEMPIDEEINLEELLAELDALEEDNMEEEAIMYERKKSKSKHEKEETAKEEKEEHASGKEKAEMKEALSVINTLRSELNEVNLLNAKLLYVNKIFKAKNLSESQKLQVIASFDKATTAKEAKVVYESLNATLISTAKKQIKESMGFASRAAGVAPNKAIVESNDIITRMQKLANIIK